MMRAGTLDRQITIMQSSVSTARSTDGAPVLVWSTMLANIWARVVPRTGSEIYRDRYRWEVAETDFFTRWTTHTITADHRIKYDGDIYEIRAVIDVDEKHVEHQFITTKHE